MYDDALIERFDALRSFITLSDALRRASKAIRRAEQPYNAPRRSLFDALISTFDALYIYILFDAPSRHTGARLSI